MSASDRQFTEEIARLSRLYSALSQVNQAIVHLKTRDDLFRTVCRVLVEPGGFHMAWVGWIDPATHELVPVAASGKDTDYLERVRIYTDDRPEGRGPVGMALRENRLYVCNDLLNDHETLPWRPEIERYGFHASAVFPIHLRGEICGALNVYAHETDYFQDKEVALLRGAAGDISFGLDNLARDEERRGAEQTMRQERDFSEAMLNTLPGVLYLYDRSGRFLRWNKNFENATGRTGAEIAEAHPLDFFAGADRELVAARINEVFENGESSVEAGFLSKDGRVTPYFFTGVVTRFAERTCLVGVGIDISKSRRAEEARLASEARYHTLFDHAPDGIVIADSNSTYKEANAAMCRMLGYTREELIGRHATDIVVPDEAAHIDPALSVIKERRDYHRQWMFRRKDGSTFPAEVMATMMPDGDLLGVIRDITERREAEKAMRELNESLEKKVAERTLELQAAVSRAEASDQIKSAFLATMSHELRTPLNSIIGFTGTVLQGLAGPLNDEQKKQLGMVRGSARHLLDLINDVLDLSKIEAGQLEVRAESFDLPALIARAAASVKPQANKKGLELVARVAPDLGSMVSDRRRVEQILLNLLNNAIKFTDKGTVTLGVEMIDGGPPKGGRPSGKAVRITVRDTGMGIKAEDAARLFQPFSQIDIGLARSHEGTGLGLAICRRLADLLGGEIFVASEWTKGSEFTVILPRQGADPS
jgi:PAS domain S-box-containing protein